MEGRGIVQLLQNSEKGQLATVDPTECQRYPGERESWMFSPLNEIIWQHIWRYYSKLPTYLYLHRSVLNLLVFLAFYTNPNLTVVSVLIMSEDRAA